MLYPKKTGQAQVGLANQGFRTKIESLELFLKFKLNLARALTFDTSLELAELTLIRNVARFKAINNYF